MEKLKNFFKTNRVFIIIFLCGFALSFIHTLYPFDMDIINYDSAYQYFLTVKTPLEIVRLLPEDYSPPLYAFILKLWTCIFGTSLFAMRSLSLFVIWGMMLLAAFPVRKAFGGGVSVLCSALFLFTTVNYKLLPEIRPTYFAYFFVTAAAVYCYLSFFKEEKHDYICFTVFSICAMYTHNLGMLSALAFYIIAILFSLFRKEINKTKRFFISGIISAVCYIPWLFVVLKQFGNVQKNYWSDSNFSISRLFNASFLFNFSDFDRNYIRFFFELIIPVVMAVTLLILLIKKLDLKNLKIFSDVKSKFPKSEKTINAFFLFLLFACPVLMWVIFSLVAHPIFTERYFYIYSGIAMLCFGVLAVKLWKKIGIILISILTAVNFVFCTVNLKGQLEYSTFPAMIQQIKDENPDKNIAFFHSHEWSLGIMMYYFPDAKHYVFDETWCVLNSYDVFPAEVTDVGDVYSISDYEDSFYVFDGRFPDTDYEMPQYFEQKEKYSVEYKGCFTEPYTYQKEWRLYRIEG